MTKTDFLRCDDALYRQMQTNLAAFDVRSHDRTGVRRAAVALTVVDVAEGTDVYGTVPQQGDAAALILTRRAAGLKHHAGQWALPGGRQEPGEIAEDTALRELAEEVGLHLGHDRVMGRLDDFTTRSGFVITPVVVWGGAGTRLTADPGEVAAIHRIPVAEFLRRDAPILQENSSGQHPVLLMPVGSSWIAAPTAALIYQFAEVAICGRSTRVAHYEQPFFAWQ